MLCLASVSSFQKNIQTNLETPWLEDIRDLTQKKRCAYHDTSHTKCSNKDS